METCSRCGEYKLFPSHKCKPSFHCEFASDELEYRYGKIIFAFDSRTATESFVSDWDAYAGEHEIASGDVESVEVLVMPSEVKSKLEALIEELDYQKNKTADDGYDDEELAIAKQDVAQLIPQIEELQSKVEVFMVGGEYVPSYYARKAERCVVEARS